MRKRRGPQRRFIHRFDAIEAAQSEQKAEQILRALAADLNQLAISTRDYAEWDGSHRFIKDRDPMWVSFEVTESAWLQNSNKHVVMIDQAFVRNINVDASDAAIIIGVFSKPLPPAQCRALLEQMGEMRQFTETLKLRAFQASKELTPA